MQSKRQPWPDVKEFNNLIGELRNTEYMMDCNRVEAENYLPLPPPPFYEESSSELMREARRVYRSIMHKGLDAHSTEKERERILKHPAIKRIGEILNHE